MQESDTGSERGPGPSTGRQGVPAPFDSTVDARGVLACDRRRQLLRLLVEAETQLSIGQLATRLTGTEDSSTEERQRVYLLLSGTHVPTLERHGLVSYDETVGTVSLEVSTDTVRDLLAWGEGGTGYGPVETGSRVGER